MNENKMTLVLWHKDVIICVTIFLFNLTKDNQIKRDFKENLIVLQDISFYYYFKTPPELQFWVGIRFYLIYVLKFSIWPVQPLLPLPVYLVKCWILTF